MGGEGCFGGAMGTALGVGASPLEEGCCGGEVGIALGVSPLGTSPGEGLGKGCSSGGGEDSPRVGRSLLEVGCSGGVEFFLDGSSVREI